MSSDDLDWVEGLEDDESRERRINDIVVADKARLLLENADLRAYAGAVEKRLEETEARLEEVLAKCEGLFAELQIVKQASVLARDAAQEAAEEAKKASVAACSYAPDHVMGQFESMRAIVEHWAPIVEEHQRVLLVMAQDFYCTSDLTFVLHGNVHATHSPFDESMLLERDRRLMCEVMNVGMHVWRLERALGLCGEIGGDWGSPRFKIDPSGDMIGMDFEGASNDYWFTPDSWYNPHTSLYEDRKGIDSKTGGVKWWDHAYQDGGQPWGHSFQTWADARVSFNFSLPVTVGR